MHKTSSILQPKKRLKFRIFLGKTFYTIRRYLWWTWGGQSFAVVQPNISYENICFQHSTPLLRQLKDVDMILQYNKITNLKIAAKKIDGVVIHPGETFSYWKLIGKPTGRKGYVEGMVLFYGSYGTGIGGGLCQLSNLIFWMTLHTPLTVTERYRHSFDVFPDSNRTQPFGSGATCVYNYRDLIIRNDTTQSFKLLLEVTNNDLIGSWTSSQIMDYSYRVYEKEHWMDSEFWGGYSRHNTLWRKVYNKRREEISDEFVTENHALMMYSPFLEYKNTQT